MAGWQQQELKIAGRGGARVGAGLKVAPGRSRASECHRKRAVHKAYRPVHVTVRAADDLCSLRKRACYHAIRLATRTVVTREDFRIVHISIQATHIHLIVEADDERALAKGMQSFLVSAAKRINAAMPEAVGHPRRGAVVADRYHTVELTSLRQVRNTICYALNNWRHHGEDRAPGVETWNVDLCSSALSFTGWAESTIATPPPGTYLPLHVRPPRTWMLGHWLEHYPPISIWTKPGSPH